MFWVFLRFRNRADSSVLLLFQLCCLVRSIAHIISTCIWQNDSKTVEKRHLENLKKHSYVLLFCSTAMSAPFWLIASHMPPHTTKSDLFYYFLSELLVCHISAVRRKLQKQIQQPRERAIGFQLKREAKMWYCSTLQTNVCACCCRILSWKKHCKDEFCSACLFVQQRERWGKK